MADAVIQVTEPRNPCYKLAKKYEVPDLAVQMQTTGYTGFHCRVLQDGWGDLGSTLARIELHPSWVTVQMVNEVKIGPILDVPALGASVRNMLEKR